MKLSEFLIKAKIAAYASGGETNERVLGDEARELSYEEGEFKYRDRYYGFNPFIGQEIVWQNDRIVWSMNYYGKVIFNTISVKKIYEFLQTAMRLVKESRPFRGPESFKRGNFQYTDKSIGDVNNFSGAEKILFHGEEIYTLIYHGGSIRSK